MYKAVSSTYFFGTTPARLTYAVCWENAGKIRQITNWRFPTQQEAENLAQRWNTEAYGVGTYAN